MPSFEIPDGPTSVALKSQLVKGQNIRTGSAMFSVTNKSGQPLAGRVSVQPQGDAKAEWFVIQGEKERNFAGNETQKITVNITAPPTVAIGDYKFRFRAVNVNDPDNDYTDSAVVTFNVAAVPKPEPSKVPWLWIILGIVLLLLIVGGVVAWLLLSGPSTPETTQIPVPDVIGKVAADAEKTITDAGLVVSKTEDTTPGKAPGTVVSETPDKGTNVDTGATITLAIAKGLKVPDLRGKPFAVAQQKLEDDGFTTAPTQVNGTPTGAAPGTIISQNPAVDAEAAADAPITLTVDPGVTVPNVVGRKPEDLGNSVKDFSVTIAVRREAGDVGVIVATTPAAGQVIPKNATLTLTVRGVPCTTRFCLSVQRMPYADYRTNMNAIMLGH